MTRSASNRAKRPAKRTTKRTAKRDEYSTVKKILAGGPQGREAMRELDDKSESKKKASIQVDVVDTIVFEQSEEPRSEPGEIDYGQWWFREGLDAAKAGLRLL